MRGVWHLWTGGSFSWHCDLHDRACSPTAPITTGDVLHLAANDPTADDDMFVTLQQAAEGRPIDLQPARA